MRPRTLLLGASLAAACSGAKGPSGLVEGQACATAGSQGSCAPGLSCRSYGGADGGATISICRATCATSADCNQVFTQNQCVQGFCSCAPGPIGADACTADDPVTVCDPDYDYCAPGVAPDAGCNAGESPQPYDAVLLCRPTAEAGDGGAGDGGAVSCGVPLTQGDCAWPQYCYQQFETDTPSCAPPQNVNAAGQDSPDPFCAYFGGPTGNDNVDQLRQSSAPFATDGPILMTLTQDRSDLYCGGSSGSGNALGQPDPSYSALCFGDGTYCGRGDDVAVFAGWVYDPASAFQTTAGLKLDKQFFAVLEQGATAGQGEALSTQDPTVASVQIGHVVPGGSWSPAGGDFLLWRCFSPKVVPTQIGGGLVPAHFAQTGSAAGNTYCTTWATGG